MAPHDDHAFHRVDAVKAGIGGTIAGGAGGLFASAVQNSLSKQQPGAWGIFTRSGGTVGALTAAGGAYTFFKAAAANLREKDDVFNTSIGAFASGAILGVWQRSLPRVVGYGTFFSVVLSTFVYTGSSLKGPGKDPEVDEYERKEFLRKNRRRPIEETIAELGEGRGITPPGYEERRRQRLKEKYGIEINPVSAKAD